MKDENHLIILILKQNSVDQFGGSRFWISCLWISGGRICFIL